MELFRAVSFLIQCHHGPNVTVYVRWNRSLRGKVLLAQSVPLVQLHSVHSNFVFAFKRLAGSTDELLIHLECIIITAIIYCMLKLARFCAQPLTYIILLPLPNHPVLEITLRHSIKCLEVGGEDVTVGLPESKTHGQVHALNYNTMLIIKHI